MAYGIFLARKIGRKTSGYYLNKQGNISHTNHRSLSIISCVRYERKCNRITAMLKLPLFIGLTLPRTLDEMGLSPVIEGMRGEQ